MKNIYTIIYILLLIALPFSIVSCDSMFDGPVFHSHVNNGLTVTSMTFSDNYTKIHLKVAASKGLANTHLDDSSQVKLYSNDLFCHFITPINVSQPKVKSIKYIAPDEAKKSGLSVLVLVDLCQSGAVIQKESDYVRKINRSFCRDNLFLAFMLPGGKVSNVIPATDYVINNYISAKSPLCKSESPMTPTTVSAAPVDQPGKVEHAYLYRSVSQILMYINNRTATTFDNAKYKDFIIFSDGQVYDDTDNMPIDPNHFEMQERLINQSHHIQSNVNVSYVNLSNSNEGSDIADNNMMRMLCMLSGGSFYNSFPAETICSDMLANFHVNISDYAIELSNPSGKIYYGNQKYIRLRFYATKGNRLLGECYKEYRLGGISDSVAVGKISVPRIFFYGIFWALLIFGVIYAVLQLIWPYIKYRMFRKKFVVKYSGSNMSINGTLVADTCYYCKAPFIVGDTIVAKCKHTMHESCWEENGQRCPEHGKHCPEGSHFYDSENLFNPRNGSFYIRWILVAVIAGLFQWFALICFEHTTNYEILSGIISMLNTDQPTDVVAYDIMDSNAAVMNASPRTFRLPLFGMYFAPFLTMGLAFLAGYHRYWKQRAIDVVVRGIIAGIIVYLIFVLEFVVILLSDMYDGMFVFDWIPWIITTYTIIWFSTYKTRIKISQSRVFVSSVVIGAGGAIIWTILGFLETQGEIVALSTCYLLLGIAITMVVARKLPLNDHYFLHVSGAVKDMDIALYKWLKQSPDTIVTIGRSVDCSLQLSWDMQADVAPVHASIKTKFDIPYLTPLDGSTFIKGKEIENDTPIRLYHGMEFQIGNTIFKFVEN